MDDLMTRLLESLTQSVRDGEVGSIVLLDTVVRNMQLTSACMVSLRRFAAPTIAAKLWTLDQ